MLRSSIRFTLLAVFSSLLVAPAGCLSTTQRDNADPPQAEQAKQAENGENMRCRREYPTGSHISQMVCYRVQHIEDRRTNDQEKVRDMQIGGAIVAPGTSQ